LWEWRKPAPDFSFLTGSCAYINDPEYDRPGKPYGNDPSIFKTMANTPASFMLWLGDNNYLREADYSSNYGIAYRYSHDRALPELQPFWAAMPHFAIWDDHDYGPDNADKSWILKESARRNFRKYWCNHSYGEENKGVYTQMRYGDCEFFMLDNRYFRSAERMQDSVDGKPNPDKLMFGKQQMEWLRNALLTSRATFKFVVNGSQVLNPLTNSECWRSFPAEFGGFMRFLDEHRISGVVFLSGDIHRTEVIKIDRPNYYPLYDITSSSITAGVNTSKLNDNPYRVGGSVQENNFSRITISGPKNDRALKVDFINKEGVVKSTVTILEKELKKQK
jgi:alkaline phosphatase D